MTSVATSNIGPLQKTAWEAYGVWTPSLARYSAMFSIKYAGPKLLVLCVPQK